MKHFQVSKQDLYKHQIVSGESIAETQLKEGEVLLKIDVFSFTANNITYASLGNDFQYWNFFPNKNNWGSIPCWGFADVISSKAEGVEVGERFYGYYPMSSHLVVKAGNIKSTGFYDVSEHRQKLSVIYNHYARTSTDIAYHPSQEDLIALFRPLFTTSFLLEDFLRDNNFWNAKNIIITSASSKTALGLAFILNENKGINVIGLTSSKNVNFVNKTSYYNQVFSYDEIEQIPNTDSSIIVDFTGNMSLLLLIDEAIKNNLAYCSMVGVSNWDNRKSDGELSIKPEVFFAPAQAQKRIAKWTTLGLMQRLGKVWIPFLKAASDWLSIECITSEKDLSELYVNMLNGNFEAKKGFIVKADKVFE